MNSKLWRAVWCGLVASCVWAASVPAWAAGAGSLAPPEPSIIPTRWELALEPGPLRVVVLDVPGVGERAYYYMTYRVTNRSGEDVFFAPMFELATDRGELIAGGRDVPRWVSQELLRRLRNPFLEDQVGIIGPVQQGVEYAKDGLVVWPVGDTAVDELTVHLIGFSGESRTVTTRDAKTGKPIEVTLRKTYMIPFRAPGHLLDRRASTEGGRTLIQDRGRWIMREPGTIMADGGNDRNGADLEPGAMSGSAR